MAADWFRSVDWDGAAQEDFEARLRRARINNRAQYVRIKALALRSVGNLAAAQLLLERVVQDPGPYAAVELPIAHELLGDIAVQKQDWPSAEAHYRHALKTWPDLQATTGTVEISLADVLARGEDPALHAEALTLLDSYLQRQSIQWQSALFRWHLVRIRLAAHTSDRTTEQASAREALRLAALGSQFPRHGDVSAVQTTPDVLEQLRRLADGSAPSGR